MATKIVTKNSSTASAVPTASDLVQGELAVNVADKRLFTEDNAGAIVELGTNPYNFTANYNGSAKLTTTATGIDVTGTATVDGLVVDGNAVIDGGATDNTVLTLDSGTPNTYLKITDSNSTNGAFIGATTNDLNLYPNNTLSAKFSAGGDISFYEDTGTTAKLFWDASAESLGIGGTPSTHRLEVKGDNNIAKFYSDATATELKIAAPTVDVIGLYTGTSDALVLGTASTERMRIDASGNVGINTSSPTSLLTLGTDTFSAAATNTSALYTSTTDGMVALADGYTWNTRGGAERMRIDSAGNVGIGTSSPLSKLNVKGTQGNWRVDPDSVSNEIQVLSTTVANDGFRDFRLRSNQSIFETGGSERMRIDSSGNVGIGTSSPASPTGFGSSGILHLKGGTGNDCSIVLEGLSGSGGRQEIGASGGALQFYRGAATGSMAESMRIDSSGNLLVGTTDTDPSNNGAGGDAGHAFSSTGYISSARSGDTVALFNRMDSNGDIASFRKDGTAVGSIGTESGNVFLNSASTGLLSTIGTARYKWDVDQFYPNGDNAKNLGTTANRFKDIYATNGTIQTSDRNEKQDIEELSDAEQRVAVTCKGLLRKFRWKDAVAEKGDEARTHFGIIAQDLQAAFTAEGLDAGDYGMFISSTWTDEETNEEKTRMGVRYSELLAFIIAAI